MVLLALWLRDGVGGTFSHVHEDLHDLTLPLGTKGRNTRLSYTGQEGIKEV